MILKVITIIVALGIIIPSVLALLPTTAAMAEREQSIDEMNG